MKIVFKWSAAILGIWVGSALAWSAIEQGRRRMRSAVERAESITAHTRAALAESEDASTR